MAAESFYRYRDFEIAIDIKPLEGAMTGSPHRTLAGYLCHVRLRSRTGSPDLPSMTLLEHGARLFNKEQDAVIAGCCAGEAAIDAALSKTVAKTVEMACA